MAAVVDRLCKIAADAQLPRWADALLGGPGQRRGGSFLVRGVAVVCLLAVVAALVFLLVQPKAYVPHVSDTLALNATAPALEAGQWRLAVGEDGDLALSRAGQAVWSAGSAQAAPDPPYWMTLAPDGTLQVRNARGTPLLALGTPAVGVGRSRVARLASDDGTLVSKEPGVKDATLLDPGELESAALAFLPPPSLDDGRSLRSDLPACSALRRAPYTLTLGAGGSLSMVRDGSQAPAWTSGVSPPDPRSGPYTLRFAADGAEIVDMRGRRAWSCTPDAPPAPAGAWQLVVSADGSCNLVKGGRRVGSAAGHPSASAPGPVGPSAGSVGPAAAPVVSVTPATASSQAQHAP